MSKMLELLFQALANSPYRITSSSDEHYNCIAWAAGHTDDWWWPGSAAAGEYWPPDVPHERTIAAFQQVFARLGYSACAEEDLETGFEKIALYADEQGKPTHAARQLSNGRWTSKLGKSEDIEHELRSLEGEIYGTVVLFLKRPTSS